MINSSYQEKYGEIITMSTISENIKRLRIANNMTIDELSKILQVNVSDMKKWDNNDLVPDQIAMERVALLFQIDADDLRNEDMRLSIINKPSNEIIATKETNPFFSLIWGALLLIQGLVSIFSSAQTMVENRYLFGGIYLCFAIVGIMDFVVHYNKPTAIIEKKGELIVLNLDSTTTVRFLLTDIATVKDEPLVGRDKNSADGYIVFVLKNGDRHRVGLLKNVSDVKTKIILMILSVTM